MPTRALSALLLAAALTATTARGQASAAGDDPAAAAPEAAAPAGGPDAAGRRQAAHRTFLRLFDEQRYAEAIAAGEQVLALTRELYGPADVRLVTTLGNLGTALLRTDDMAGARARFEEAIAIAEAAEGVASPRLVQPLVGLAETQARAQDWEDAQRSYERALTINHATEGLFNPAQAPILDGLAETWLGLEKLERANDQYEVQYRIAERNASGRQEELLPALYKLGEWYNRTGQYPLARGAWQSARRIIRDTRGEDSVDLVDTLVGEARTYQNEGAYVAAAKVLRRALEALDRQPAPDRLKRAEVLVASGDLGILARLTRTAQRDYETAWKELSGEPALEARRAEYFAEPVRLAGPVLPRTVNEKGRRVDPRKPAAGGTLPGQVLAALTIGADGRASDVVIRESDPPGLLDRQVVQALEFTAWRPRLADGVAAASPDQSFRHGFRYPRPPSSAGSDAGADPSSGNAGDPLRNPAAAGD